MKEHGVYNEVKSFSKKYRFSRDYVNLASVSLLLLPKSSDAPTYYARETSRDLLRPSNPLLYRNVYLQNLLSPLLSLYKLKFI